MTILSVAKLRTLVEVSDHKKDTIIEFSIEAMERLFIKKYFEDSIFIYLLENNGTPTDLITLLLDGGKYVDTSDTPKNFYLNGIDKATSLLVYCDLMVKQTSLTRFGAVNKNDSYSSKPDFDNVLEQINRYRSTALAYLKDIDYMLINADITSFEAAEQTLIELYRTDNNNKVKEFLNY